MVTALTALIAACVLVLAGMVVYFAHWTFQDAKQRGHLAWFHGGMALIFGLFYPVLYVFYRDDEHGSFFEDGVAR